MYVRMVPGGECYGTDADGYSVCMQPYNFFSTECGGVILILEFPIFQKEYYLNKMYTFIQ